MDFGLAKAIWRRQVNQDLSQSAAVTDPETVAGHIVGLPGSISPEQALERRRYFAGWPEARVCPQFLHFLCHWPGVRPNPAGWRPRATGA
jgi:hypothetical protein